VIARKNGEMKKKFITKQITRKVKRRCLSLSNLHTHTHTHTHTILNEFTSVNNWQTLTQSYQTLTDKCKFMKQVNIYRYSCFSDHLVRNQV
jgi:hypothetical protein